MLSRTERIEEFPLKLSRAEKELYEEFLKTEEAALVLEMQQYFGQAKGHAGGIRFDNAVSGRRSKTEWVFGSRRFVQTGIKTKTWFVRSKEAILHRMRNQLAKTIRESLGRK